MHNKYNNGPMTIFHPLLHIEISDLGNYLSNQLFVSICMKL